MPADPIRERFNEVGADVFVMPALAGLSSFIAAHQLNLTAISNGLSPANYSAGLAMRFLVFGIVAHFGFSFSMLHRCRTRSRTMLAVALFGCSVAMTYLLAFYLVWSHQAVSYARGLISFFVLTLIYQTLRYNARFRQLAKHRETVLILGTGREAQKSWKHIRIECDRLLSFKGFVAETSSKGAAPDITAQTVCSIDALATFLQHTPVDTFVLTETGPAHAAFGRAARRIAKECGVRILIAQELKQTSYNSRNAYVELDRPDALALASKSLKTFADRLLSGAALLLLTPLALPLLLLYQLVLGEFPLVSQAAYGSGRRQFTMWDLRIATSQEISVASRRLPRIVAAQVKSITRLGYFLKISGLARAPRLWNVLAGDMSLVGPRPVLCAHAEHDADALLRRYTMRPGLCWPKPELAQTEDRATLFYLEQWTLVNDWHTFTDWVQSRVQRTLYAVSASLLPDPSTLTEPTQRTR